MAAPLRETGDESGADFYGALLACVRTAERDGYAELPLNGSTNDIRPCITELRGFACRVRFAFRATTSSIEKLQLRECCDGWPVEQVALDPPPTTVVLVVQRRQGMIEFHQTTLRQIST
jgi:hypothetical protein